MKSKNLVNSITTGMFIFAFGFISCQMSPSSSDSAGSPDSAASAPAALESGTAVAPAKVQHMVCFKFKEGVTEEQKQQHMADFAALKDSIPEVKSYSGAYTFEVSYEKTADYDCMHIAGFDSEEGLETYFHHPAHQRFIERNKDAWADVIVVNSKE
ncbi:stress responsive alpha/beta barrel protein [Anseongella ginsenosidimutans]|uniref:Stress responsive alpha/beta barrel protein n=1 Tax=Anseongella ginsenosidimutans TaxID=496056 RepID=A0A4R3KWP0_9SPHI|nr:Dabb family protein [Anseongella ginsenosidimutans]QEC51462.1 Dabb family protein [Anseongella ginsenosidimutans]TCS89828.1 stress responsive alpha/beta barrel protein [Anseongella ginsenosidimutans]